MIEAGVHRLEVEAVLSDFSTRETGAGLVAYHGESGGQKILVVVVEDSDPLFVVAVAEEE
jgi:hypothetical protein